MTDEKYYDLIERACRQARHHIRKHWSRRERPCVESLLDEIEMETHARTFAVPTQPATRPLPKIAR